MNDFVAAVPWGEIGFALPTTPEERLATESTENTEQMEPQRNTDKLLWNRRLRFVTDYWLSPISYWSLTPDP